MPTHGFLNRKPERTHRSLTSASRIVGEIYAEGPPVPIPNTEVKLCRAEDTWLATARENRYSPTPSTEGRRSLTSVFSVQNYILKKQKTKVYLRLQKRYLNQCYKIQKYK